MLTEKQKEIVKVIQNIGFDITEVTSGEVTMGLVDALKQSGFQPTVNQDGQFEALTGQYRTSIQVLRTEPATDKQPERWQAQYFIEEVLEGDQVDTTVGYDKRRRFFKTYQKTEDGLKMLLNDMFTCGVQLDTTTDEGLEASFAEAIGKDAYIRAWSWRPETTRDGQVIPEHERRNIQQMVVKAKSAIKLGKGKKGSTVPF